MKEYREKENKKKSNENFDCFREFMATSSWGWHAMVSFAE